MQGQTSGGSTDRGGFGFYTYAGAGTGSDSFTLYYGAAFANNLTTTQVFRDPAAWYHFVLAVDTTQATAANRALLYVNGIQITSFSAANYPTLNYQFAIGNNVAQWLCSESGSGYFFDGEMAEVNFVDGQALAPTAFGAYSIYNQWLPIRYAGTYGTNGFYLPFNSVSTSSYAGSFNGSTQYITAPSNAAFNLVTNDFTVECWLYSTVAGATQYFAGKSSSAGLANSIVFYKDPANALALYVKTSGGVDITATSAATIPLNTWTHVAGVRNGATLNLYINGVQDGTAALSTSAVATTTEVFAVGATGSFATGRWNGSVSNFRLVNGTAVYTANFVPPTAPLTAITNTSLLTLQNATIVDNSTNAFTITNNGTVVTSVQSPFLVSTVLTADSSGNGNNWTPNNISLTAGSTYDSLTDVPTLTSTTVANYAVLNPLDSGSSTLSINGNLTYSNAAASHLGIRGSIAIPASGAFYMECVTGSTTNNTSAVAFGLGASTVSLTATLSAQANLYQLWAALGGYIYNGATVISSSLGAFSAGDVMQIAVDVTNTKMWLGKNNVWYNNSGGTTGNPSTGANPTFTTSMVGLFPTTGAYANSVNANFGQQPFTYTAPTGFLPLNTFNI